MRKAFLALIPVFLQPALAEEPAAADAATAGAAIAPLMSRIVMHKSPGCGCCAVWAEHLQSHGFEVETVADPEVQALKAKLGIPAAARSCHTARVGQYFIEGHVPASDILRLLAQRPTDVKGLTVPGMPLGSPGMDHPNGQYYRTKALMNDGSLRVFAEHHPGEDYSPQEKPMDMPYRESESGHEEPGKL